MPAQSNPNNKSHATTGATQTKANNKIEITFNSAQLKQGHRAALCPAVWP